MKLLLTFFAVLFYVALATSAPVDEEARDKRHLLLAHPPAVVPVPWVASLPLSHGPVVVGPHWGSHLTYGHPATVVKYW